MNTAISSVSPAVVPSGATGTFAVTVGNLPAGLSLNATTGEITGTPTAVTSGAVSVTVEMTGTGDYKDEKVSKQFDITVNAISGTSLSYSPNTLSATVGTLITQLTPIIGPTGATGSYSVSPSLPAGLNIASDTGIISGTPTAVTASAQYTVTFTADGNYTGTPTEVITIAVNAKAITSIDYTSITGTVNTAISSVSPAVVPSGATGTFAVTVGNLPAGLSLDAGTGGISGTPTAVTSGAVSVTVEMTGTGDYKDEKVSKQFDITVNAISGTSLSYSPNTLSATVGTLITQLTPIIGPTGATGSYSVSPSLPAGLNIASDTGIISGTPTAVTASAQYTVTFTADGNYTGTPTEVITIAVNAKAITSIDYTSITGTVNTAISSVSPAVVPSGATGTFAVTVGNLPAGLSLDAGTGGISGTPTAVTSGAVAVTVEMTGTGDYKDEKVSKQFDITVNAIAVTSLSYSPNTLSATVGTLITQLTPIIGPTGATGSYSVSPSLPAGLNIASDTGIISGTPTAVTASAQYTVTFTADGNYTGTPTEVITIAVNAKTITSIDYTSITGTVNTAISSVSPTVVPSGATGTFAVTVGNLPAGLSLDAGTGGISGTPTAVTSGAVSVTVEMTGTGDYKDEKVSKQFDITINAISVTSLSYSSNTLSATVGTPITLTPAMLPAGATGSYSLSPSLPAGLNIASDTGIISGTPTAVTASAQYTVTFTADGNYTGTPTEVITIAVNAKTITSIDYTSITGTVNTAISSVSPAVVPSGATGTFAVTVGNLPAGLSLDAGTGGISGTPTAVTSGAVSVTVEMTGTGDYKDEKVSKQFDITINAISVTSLSYSSNTLSATVGTPITLTPAILPSGATGSYSVSPSLPVGLNIASDTGIISGTPTAVTASAQYTVTFTANGNYSGITTENFNLAVNIDLSNTALTYSSATISTVLGTAETTGIQPTWTLTSSTGITYSIVATTTNGPGASGVTANTVNIDSATGKITLTDQLVAKHKGDYMVTATADSTSDYADGSTATATITVKEQVNMFTVSPNDDPNDTQLGKPITLNSAVGASVDSPTGGNDGIEISTGDFWNEWIAPIEEQNHNGNALQTTNGNYYGGHYKISSGGAGTVLSYTFINPVTVISATIHRRADGQYGNRTKAMRIRLLDGSSNEVAITVAASGNTGEISTTFSQKAENVTQIQLYIDSALTANVGEVHNQFDYINAVIEN